VPDERFEHLCNVYKPASKVSAYLEVTDIAGLVRGASKGEGLGNAFLSHIRAVDGIYQVVRAFDDDSVTHVDETIDPIRDLETISEELLLKDIEFIYARIEDCEKRTRVKKTKAVKDEREFLDRLLDWTEKQRKPVRVGEWKVAEIEILNEMLLLTSKPTIYLVNLSEEHFIARKNKWLGKIKNWIDKYSAPFVEPLIPFCGSLSASQATEAQAAAALASKDPSVQAAGTLAKIVNVGYSSLDLIHFFTAGADEVRCWTIRRGTKAPQAAGVIHTDFEKGFICAEIFSYDDLQELGTEQKVKAVGKCRQHGKDYVMEDGEIVFFRANTSGLKKK
jgi:obg-like ATPase 1